VDVLLMPPDPEGAIQAVLEAVQSGRLPRKRIDESAARVLAAKVRLGLTKKKLVELDAVADGIGGAEEVERAQAISDQAITLVKNEGGVLPLDPGARTCMILTLERRTSGVGARMLAEFQRRAREGRSMVLDSTLPRAALIAAGGDTRACTALVVVSSVTPATLRSDLRLAGELGPFLEELMEGPAPVALVSLGTPYLLAAYPKAAAYVATFSPTVPSEISAVKALFGEIPIRGRMPVSIPGFAAPGDGIQKSVARPTSADAAWHTQGCARQVIASAP
jgi:beta-N-acetylhexosaminidase